MTINSYLEEIENKVKSMIFYQEKAGQEVSEGPYPQMLSLIKALRLAIEQRDEWSELYRDQFLCIPQLKTIGDEDAELLEILKGGK